VSPHGKRLSDDISASEAPLRCETRRYLDDSRSGILGFEREYVDKRRPTRVGDGTGEIAVLEHVLDSEIFDANKSVAFNVDPSRLVRVIHTLAGDLEVLLEPIARRRQPSTRVFCGLSSGRCCQAACLKLLGP
jgi:hypothetical protein